jgi:hypothetical protein
MYDTLIKISTAVTDIYGLIQQLTTQEEGDGGLTQEEVTALHRATLKYYALIAEATIHIRRAEREAHHA